MALRSKVLKVHSLNLYTSCYSNIISSGQHPSLQGSSKALATVTAIIDGTGSIGAAIGPFLAGALSGNNHWGRVFNMLMIADVLALIFLLRLVTQEFLRWRHARQATELQTSEYQSINS